MTSFSLSAVVTETFSRLYNVMSAIRMIKFLRFELIFPPAGSRKKVQNTKFALYRLCVEKGQNCVIRTSDNLLKMDPTFLVERAAIFSIRKALLVEILVFAVTGGCS